MTFGAGSGSGDILPPQDGANAELLAQAQRIEALGTLLVDRPDWEETQIRFQAPLDAQHRVELLARTSSPSCGKKDFREIGIFYNNDEGYRFFDLMATLTGDAGEQSARVSVSPDLAALLHLAEGVDDDVTGLLIGAADLRHDANQEAIAGENRSKSCRF